MNSSSNGSDIDQLLRSFFRREMPARWPSAPERDVINVARPTRSMASNRVLVGLSLVALLAAYVGLAAFFPREKGSGLNPNGQPVIGQRPGVVPAKTLPTFPEAHP